MMLTLCEDAIEHKGKVNVKAGVYFRLVWEHGMSDAEVRRYFREVYSLYESDPNSCLFPESILLKLDKNWITDFPTYQETTTYKANTLYIEHLLSKLGENTGKVLECLAEYIISCMPGCKTYLRKSTHSTDLDVVCSIEGLGMDFRSDLGRYIVCECKDWDNPAGFSPFAKFCRILDSTKSKFGILFSKEGISGRGEIKNARREQLKIFQDRGIVIVVIDKSDLEQIAKGFNFISMLREKYEKVRLDLR